MRVIDILTKPLVSKETRNLLGFISVTGIWAFLIYTGLKSGSFDEKGDIFTIAAMQLLMIVSYADYRASVVGKELLKEKENIEFRLKLLEQAK